MDPLGSQTLELSPRGSREEEKRCAWKLPLLRASVNGLWSSRRSALPAVAHPAYPDESPDDDYHVGEGYPEVDHPPIPLGTPHKLLMGVVPGVRPLNHHRKPAVSGALLSFSEITPTKLLSSRSRRVTFES
jgi:hypothetical protein